MSSDKLDTKRKNILTNCSWKEYATLDSNKDIIKKSPRHIGINMVRELLSWI